ncbi:MULTISPECIES: FeoC-like transcriptional regulator [Vibrio]|uniref:Iron transporter FeoC n=2 Tax=Vibrio TaxID=662 RepID=A0A1E5DBB1_9VIBR|nr:MULTISPECIES: FeoC-like transcriptional regulator [Vibrio]RBW66394.1 iron transporter FeoC [Vibrionales bacterium C3R12]MDN3698737.1 FeoC-like transcriptional regulator [Vibrio cortegadensis]NOH83371.1 iron transporter FeoC [Vibrio sp. 03-59-1]OEE81085.1 iron transporter FeoC [Vibrio genomosp. F6 str. FF-238]TKF23893.1 iron transporter FeoC [Vibrio genomosp. F6]
MILSDLKNYITENGSASRNELAKKFTLSEDGVDAMLSVWVKKGQISRLIDTNKAKKVTRVRYSTIKSDELSLTVTM